MAVDRADNRHRPQVPWLRLDQEKIFTLLNANKKSMALVWLGLPCGTFSRARRTTDSTTLESSGRSRAQALANRQVPPGPADGLRQRSRQGHLGEPARRLLLGAGPVLHHREHPLRHRKSAALHPLAGAQDRQPPARRHLRRRLRTTPARMAERERERERERQSSAITHQRPEPARIGAVACDKSHSHKPWGVKFNESKIFIGSSSADEAEYPAIFCQRIAKLTAQTARHRGPPASRIAIIDTAKAMAKPPRPTDAALRLRRAQMRATVGSQPRGRALGPLTSEHKLCTTIQLAAPAAALLPQAGHRITENMNIGGIIMQKDAKTHRGVPFTTWGRSAGIPKNRGLRDQDQHPVDSGRVRRTSTQARPPVRQPGDRQRQGR